MGMMAGQFCKAVGHEEISSERKLGEKGNYRLRDFTTTIVI